MRVTNRHLTYIRHTAPSLVTMPVTYAAYLRTHCQPVTILWCEQWWPFRWMNCLKIFWSFTRQSTAYSNKRKTLLTNTVNCSRS